jgi:hypothetical protein
MRDSVMTGAPALFGVLPRRRNQSHMLAGIDLTLSAASSHHVRMRLPICQGVGANSHPAQPTQQDASKL